MTDGLQLKRCTQNHDVSIQPDDYVEDYGAFRESESTPISSSSQPHAGYHMGTFGFNCNEDGCIPISPKVAAFEATGWAVTARELFPLYGPNRSITPPTLVAEGLSTSAAKLAPAFPESDDQIFQSWYLPHFPSTVTQVDEFDIGSSSSATTPKGQKHPLSSSLASELLRISTLELVKNPHNHEISSSSDVAIGDFEEFDVNDNHERREF